MLYHVSIHRPKPEHERDVIDSMHRFGAAARLQDGLLEVHTLKDRRSDALIGFAVWESAAASLSLWKRFWMKLAGTRRDFSS